MARTMYAAPYAQFQVGSTRYVADLDGVIANVKNSDTNKMLTSGASLSVLSSVGLYGTPIRLSDLMGPTGVSITAASVAGQHYFANTTGTSFAALSEVAQTNTKTDTSFLEYVVPSNYTDGAAITVTVNSKTLGAGTPGTVTVGVVAYRLAKDGTEGANICSTAAQALSAAATDYAFTVAGATLNPGDRLIIGVQTVIQETGGVALQGSINSVRFG